MTAFKRTALFSRHQSLGVAMAEPHGWQIPAAFSSESEEVAQVHRSAGLADVSWTAKLDLKGSGVNTLPALSPRSRSWILGPSHLLVTGDAELGSDLPGVWVTDVTSVFAQFLLAGPRSRDVLRKVTSLNVSASALPDLGCGQASLAHVRAIILRQDLGNEPAFHLLVSREYAESVWDSLLHAGQEFHVAPFGLKALQTLGG
jgi:aminomethyltransferase